MDKYVVLDVVQQDWRFLNDAAKSLKGDRDVVLAAFQQKGWASLKYDTAKGLKGDEDIDVLVAIYQD